MVDINLKHLLNCLKQLVKQSLVYGQIISHIPVLQAILKRLQNSSSTDLCFVLDGNEP
jgi:hypothetical protein